MCLAAQHQVGDPQASMGQLSHPAAEQWHQWQLSAWTVSQHLTLLLGHRQTDSLVITHNQKLWQLYCPGNSHSKSSYSPTDAFATCTTLHMHKFTTMLYICICAYICTHTNIYLEKLCCQVHCQQLLQLWSPVWDIHAADLILHVAVGAKCSREPSDGPSGTAVFQLPGPPQKTVGRHWVNKTSC